MKNRTVGFRNNNLFRRGNLSGSIFGKVQYKAFVTFSPYFECDFLATTSLLRESGAIIRFIARTHCVL